MPDIAALLAATPSGLVYALVAALVFAEPATIVGTVLPTTTALVAAGALAATGSLDPLVLVVVAALAAAAGDQVGFALGRRWAVPMRSSVVGRLVPSRLWSRADAMVADRPVAALAAGRWFAGARVLVPLLSGASGLAYRTFAVIDAAACLSWAAAVTAVGYLGTSVLAGAAEPVALALIAAVAATVVVRRRRSGGADAAVVAA